MRSGVESHVDGRHLGRLVRMPVLCPQVRRVEGAADGGEEIVRVRMRRRMQRNERSVIAVGARRLAADVAVLPPLLVAHVGRALGVVVIPARTLDSARSASGRHTALNLLVDGIDDAFFQLLGQRLPRRPRPHVDLHVRVVPRTGRPVTPLGSAQLVMVRHPQRKRVLAELSDELSVQGGAFSQRRIGHRMRVVATAPPHAPLDGRLLRMCGCPAVAQIQQLLLPRRTVVLLRAPVARIPPVRFVRSILK